MRPRVKRLARSLALLGSLAAVLGLTTACDEFSFLQQRSDQIVQPSYPRGLSLSPDGNTLAVVSSNFEAEFLTGAVMLADVSGLDATLAGGSPAEASSQSLTGLYFDSVYIPSFGNRPVFTDDGDHLFVTAQGDNLLLEILFQQAMADGGSTGLPSMTCLDTPVPPTAPELCTAEGTGDTGNDLALSLDQNDPYELVLYAQNDTEVLGAATFLSASRITFFRLRPARTGQNRLQLRGSLELGEGVEAITTVTLHPRGGGRSPLLVAALEREDPIFATQTELELIWLDPTDGTDATVRRLDLEALTGARSGRALTSSPDGDALFLAIRDPDGLVRLDTQIVGSTLQPRLGGVVPVCDGPTAMQFARIPLPDGSTADRLLVVCYGDHTVAAYNPLTLAQTDAVRDFGIGAYDLAVDVSGTTPRVYVSYFDDDTIGVIDLVDADGAARLVPRARIGVPDDREARQ